MLIIFFLTKILTYPFQIRRVSRLYNIEELRHDSEKMLSKNMARVLESPTFQEMDLDEMLELLSADDIRDPDEVMFWRGALRWLLADPEKRRKHAARVMEHVRFPLIDSRVLVEHILPHPLMAEQEACRRLVLEAMQYQLLSTEQSRRQTARTKPRYSRGSSAIIYCISGDRSFMCYIPAPHNRWYSLQSPAPTSVDTQGQLQYNILVVNGYVYALGQVRRSVEAANFQVECLQKYNITTNTWCTCAVPTHEKYVPTLIEADRKLLAVFRDVVMEYNPDEDAWDTLAEYNIGPFDLVVSNNNNTLDLYNLGEGLCHQVALNTRRQRRSKNQILTPSLFLTDLLDVTKLNHYEILLSMRTSSGMTRKIFNARSEMWSDADLYQGPYSREPKPRTNFPQALCLNDLWVCLCDRPYSMLYVLGTRTGLADGGSRRATGPPSGPSDGILPFYSFDLEMHTWKRLVGFPEKLLSPYMKVCIDDGQPFTAVPESRVWPLFDWCESRTTNWWIHWEGYQLYY